MYQDPDLIQDLRTLAGKIHQIFLYNDHVMKDEHHAFRVEMYEKLLDNLYAHGHCLY